MKTLSKLWLFIVILIILTPLGLILPQHFKAPSAWGEWGMNEIKELAGYIPAGFKKLSTLWNSPMPDYAFKGWENKPLSVLSLAYIVSAAAGILITVGIVFVIGRFLIKKE